MGSKWLGARAGGLSRAGAWDGVSGGRVVASLHAPGHAEIFDKLLRGITLKRSQAIRTRCVEHCCVLLELEWCQECPRDLVAVITSISATAATTAVLATALRARSRRWYQTWRRS